MYVYVIKILFYFVRSSYRHTHLLASRFYLSQLLLRRRSKCKDSRTHSLARLLAFDVDLSAHIYP